MLNAHYIVSFIKENAEGWWSTSHTHTLTHTKYLVNRYSGPSIQRRIVILFFFLLPSDMNTNQFLEKKGEEMKWNTTKEKETIPINCICLLGCWRRRKSNHPHNCTWLLQFNLWMTLSILLLLFTLLLLLQLNLNLLLLLFYSGQPPPFYDSGSFRPVVANVSFKIL